MWVQFNYSAHGLDAADLWQIRQEGNGTPKALYLVLKLASSHVATLAHERMKTYIP